MNSMIRLRMMIRIPQQSQRLAKEFSMVAVSVAEANAMRALIDPAAPSEFFTIEAESQAGQHSLDKLSIPCIACSVPL